MAELTGPAGEAVVDVTSGNDAKPDAATEGDGDEVIDGSTPAVEPLGDRQGVDVVVDQHGNADPLLEQGC